MGTRLLEFGGIRLAINQSVVPVEVEHYLGHEHKSYSLTHADGTAREQ